MKLHRVPSGVAGAELYRLPLYRDARGSLAVAELERDLPFPVQRCFWVFAVPGLEVRGEHAHRECHQFLVCVAGQLSVILDDGTDKTEILLDSPEIGLHIPPMIWSVQSNYSRDAVLVVLASHVYDPNDYIRDYTNFRKTKAQT